MGCCKSCEEGHACDSEKAPCGEVPLGVIIPHEPDLREVIEDSQEEERAEEDFGPFARLRSGKSIPVNTHLAMSDSTTTASEPLRVGDCNAVSVDVVVFGLTAQTTLEIRVEVGFDLQNYLPLSSTYFQNAGFARFRVLGIACPWLRFYFKTIGNAGSLGLIATTVSGAN